MTLQTSPSDVNISSRIVPEIVNTMKDGMDEEKYSYVVCECMPLPYGIRIAHRIGYTTFKCPNCGRRLGITRLR